MVDLGVELPIESVARLEHDLLALGNFEHGLDIGMIAVVSGSRLRRQRLAAIDLDAVHASPDVIGAGPVGLILLVVRE